MAERIPEIQLSASLISAAESLIEEKLIRVLSKTHSQKYKINAHHISWDVLVKKKTNTRFQFGSIFAKSTNYPNFFKPLFNINANILKTIIPVDIELSSAQCIINGKYLIFSSSECPHKINKYYGSDCKINLIKRFACGLDTFLFTSLTSLSEK